MSKICRICQKEFEILSQFGGSRQFCYECVPSDLDRQERTNEKRRAIKKRALSLLGGKCLKCGITEPYLIDFHHVESELKENSFGRLVADSKIEDYFKELEKAIPLCSNCHRTFHHLERQEGLKISDFVDLERFLFHVESENREYTRIKKPTKEKFSSEEAQIWLEKIKKGSFTSLANELGVSSTAVQKRLKENGFPYLIKDIKGIPEKKEKTVYLNWRNSPIELEKNGEKYSFNTGDEAANFLQEVSNGTDLDKIREGISRVLRGKRKTYLSFKIIKV